MTIVTRYPAALVNADSLTLMSWASGISPNRRYVPGRLPAVAANIDNWVDQLGGSSLTYQPSVSRAVVAAEAGVKHAFVGLPANSASILGLNAAAAGTLRTVIILARPNTGDAYTGASATNLAISNSSDIQITQGVNVDTVSITGGGASLAAARDKWHMYAYSIPDAGSGVFVVDNNDTTAAPPTRVQPLLFLGRGANSRQLRVLEVITSASVVDAATLKTAYQRVKAWYPNLAWV